MTNREKVFKAVKSGLRQIPDIAKKTGLYETEVMNAINGLKYAEGINMRVRTKTIKVKTVELVNGGAK